jgi:hypothetical protein
MRKLLIGFIVIFLHQNLVHAQHPKDSIDKIKLRNIILAESALYAGTMTGLGFLWYKETQSQSFQFFNDNNQWLQMDKVGHIYTSYHLTELNYQLLQNAGISPKKAMLISSITSTAMMLPIEIFDGFSDAYGASTGDALANAIGAFLPYQQFLFDQNYIYPKFSFSPSPYAKIRTNTLGHNFVEQLIKDYNGQTYWLSTDLNIFSKKNTFPNWLQFSLGYSGNQMVYGSPQENFQNGYNSNREWLLSMDLNLSKMEVEQKWLKIIFKVINKVKIPFPAVEWNGKDVVLHPLYF